MTESQRLDFLTDWLRSSVAYGRTACKDRKNRYTGSGSTKEKRVGIRVNTIIQDEASDNSDRVGTSDKKGGIGGESIAMAEMVGYSCMVQRDGDVAMLVQKTKI